MPRPRKTLKKPQNIRTWLRQRTSPYCFGVKTKKGNPAHVNKNDDILYHFSCLKMGWYGRRLCRLKNKDMSDHFAGKKTYYFTSDGRSSVPEVLVNIDIDCHNAGSLEGAMAFAEHLRTIKFPNLYFEASTNGKGVHGYVVVLKRNMGDEGLNSALGQLDLWLKAELSKGSWDVEAVEVKAQAPQFDWGQEKYELKGYKSGQLAKLPREALTRADELRGTTRVAVDDLRRLKVPAKHVESQDSVVGMKKNSPTRKPSVVSVRESENRDEETLVVSPPFRKKVSGSISGRHFDEDELSKLKGGYLSLASVLLGGEVLVAKGRRIVTEEDMAIFLMLLRFFSNNMNADGSLPVARWREMWAALFGTGDVGRAWCHHRFAAMRNFLSDKCLLSWEDENFVVGVYSDEGRFVPGKASRWKAGEDLLAMISAVELQEVEVGGGILSSEACGVEAVGEKEEGESILYGHNQSHVHLDVLVTDQDNPTEGPETTDYTPTTLDPRYSTSFQSFLDDFGLWIPVPKPRFAGYSTGTYRMAA